MFRTVVALLALLLPTLAVADVGPISSTSLGLSCTEYEMCQDHAAATTCTNGADEAVLTVNAYAAIALNVDGSTGTYTVNVECAGVGHDTLGAAGKEMLSADITQASTSQWETGAASIFRYCWVEVQACTTCSVDAFLQVCK
jgi:hypothetical protein